MSSKLKVQSSKQKTKQAASRLPKRVRTLRVLAELVRHHFKIPCDRMKLKNWQTRRDPPFPSPGANNEYEVKGCLEWVGKYVAAAKAAKHRTSNIEQPTSKGESDTETVNLALLDRRAEIARWWLDSYADLPSMLS